MPAYVTVDLSIKHRVNEMKFFKDCTSAQNYHRMKKQTNREKHTIYILTDGPENDFVVMTLKEFFALGLRDAEMSYQF